VRSRQMDSRLNYPNEMWIVDPRNVAAATAYEVIKFVRGGTRERTPWTHCVVQSRWARAILVFVLAMLGPHITSLG
jgi:hypothetical protein